VSLEQVVGGVVQEIRTSVHTGVGAANGIILWDLAPLQSSLTLTGHTAAVTCAAFAPDGKTVATGSSDKTVKLWDAVTGTERATLRSHLGGIRALLFSHDGGTLFTASEDRTVKRWHVATGKVLATL